MRCGLSQQQMCTTETMSNQIKNYTKYILCVSLALRVRLVVSFLE